MESLIVNVPNLFITKCFKKFVIMIKQKVKNFKVKRKELLNKKS